MSLRITRLIAATAVLAAASLAGSASGADPKPEPSSCAGLAISDPAGDATYKVDVVGPPVPPADTMQKAPDNHDIVGGFFRDVTSGGKEVLTANVHVVNLDKSVALGADAVGYWFYFTAGDAVDFVVAYSDGGDWVYRYGHNDTGGYILDGTTKGTTFDGKDGVMSIEVPITELKLAGQTLTAPFVISTQVTLGPGDPVLGSDPIAYSDVDDATDDRSGGKPFQVTPCAEAGAPTGATPTEPAPPPATGPATAPPAPPTQGGSGPTQTPATATPAKVTFIVTVKKLSARKLKKGKTITVLVQPSGPVTALKATLKSGKKVVAKGKAAKLTGKTKVKLKVSAKKLKKGAYTLGLVAKDAAGKSVTGFVSVRMAK